MKRLLGFVLFVVLSLNLKTSVAQAQAGITFAVNTRDLNNDGTCNATHCSLQEAILAANATPARDTIAFNFTLPQPGYSATYVIDVSCEDGPLAPITAPVILDGTTQPDYQPRPDTVVVIEGGNRKYSSCWRQPGLEFTGGGSTIRGLKIIGFHTAIILRNGGGNVVVANYIWNEYPDPNSGAGILIDNSPGNRIGGTSSSELNYINSYGENIRIQGTGSVGNMVMGNRIGMTNTTYGTKANVMIDNAPNTQIGGTHPGARNIIAGYVSHNIVVTGSGANRTVIQGNWIGVWENGHTDQTYVPDGTELGDGIRLLAGSSGAQIGGTEAGAGNVIAGYNNNGILIQQSTHNVIQGNRIGTTPDGMSSDYYMKCGICLSEHAFNNLIGGTQQGAGNLIASGSVAGIEIHGHAGHSDAWNTVIQGNLIGTNITGTAPMDRNAQWHGIHIMHASGNTVGGEGSAGNIIAFHLTHGVHLTGVEAHNNRISGNSIFDNNAAANDKPGIWLQNGANYNQASPTLTAAVTNGASLRVSGTLSSAPNTTYRLEVFANPACHATGRGEGKRYLGAGSVTTDAAGQANFTISVGAAQAGEIVTATATDPSGNTSEFSVCFPVHLENTTPTPTPTPTRLPPSNNLLVNGGFQTDSDGNGVPDYWTGRNLAQYDAWDCMVGGNTPCTFRFYGGDGSPLAELEQIIDLAGQAGEAFIFQAWSTSNSEAGSGGTYKARTVFYYTDGSLGIFEYGFPVTMNHTWTFLDKSISPAKPYNKIAVAIMYGEPRGTVWFDDVKLLSYAQNPVATPQPTATLRPTNTPMPRPTSTPVPTTQPPSGLAAPVLIAPAPASSTSRTPTMQWKSVSGAARYRLYLSTTPSFSTLVTNQSLTTTSYTRTTALTVGQTYYWKVRAASASGTVGPWSDVGSFTVTGSTSPTATPPPAPTATSTASPGGTERITNGSFEADSNVDGMPDGWTLRNLTTGSGRVCNVAFLGTCSVRFNGGSTLNEAYQRFNIVGSAGDMLTLRLMMRQQNAGTTSYRAKMVLYHTDGTYGSFSYSLAGGTSDWVQFTRSITTQKSYSRIQITLQYGASSGTVWFDVVSLSK